MIGPVDQPGAVAGAVAGQPGDGDRAAAAHPDDPGDPAPAPGPGAWRPHRLAGLVLEEDPGAEGRRGSFTRGQVSFFRTSMAPSSRSVARLAPGWQLQPRRRSRYQVPGMVYRTPNLSAIRSRIRASVHRWSYQPEAAGPASSTRSSSASWSAPSRHRAACPFEASPGAPPASQARRHRCTDRSDTRSSAAMRVVMGPLGRNVQLSRVFAADRPGTRLARWDRALRRRRRPRVPSAPVREGSGETLSEFPFVRDRYVIHRGRSNLSAVWESGDTAHPSCDWASDHHEPHWGLVEGAAATHDELMRAFRAEVGPLDEQEAVEALTTRA
jgi:hypothetical protein